MPWLIRKELLDLTKIRASIEFEADFEAYVVSCAEAGIEATKDSFRDWVLLQLTTTETERVLVPGSLALVTEDNIPVKFRFATGPLATDSDTVQ